MSSRRKAAHNKSGHKDPAHKIFPLPKRQKLSFEQVEKIREDHILKLKEIQRMEQALEERRGLLAANSVRYPYMKAPYRKTQMIKNGEIFGQNYCDAGGYGNYADQQPCSTSSFTQIDDFPNDIKQEGEEDPLQLYHIENPEEIDNFANQMVKNEEIPGNGLNEAKEEPVDDVEEDKYSDLFDFLNNPRDSSTLEPVDLEIETLPPDPSSPSPSPPPRLPSIDSSSSEMEHLFEELELNLLVFCENLTTQAVNLTEPNRRMCSNRIAYLTKMFRSETGKALECKKSKIVKGFIVDNAVPTTPIIKNS